MGFRVFQVLNGEEPEQKVELATLAAPTVTAKSTTPNSITLSWNPVEDAVEYQLFEYSKETNLVKMLGRVTDTSAVMDGLEPDSTHAYIVQPISYTAICDNVSGEYSIEATCMSEFVLGDVNADGIFNLADVIALQKWLLAVPDTELANWKAADFYEDDCLNVFDLCVMKQVLTDNH